MKRNSEINFSWPEHFWIILIFCLFCIITISGCISTRVTLYEEVETDSTLRDNSVKIIDLAHVDRAYKVIGYIEIKASELYGTESIFRRMRKRAHKMGGDALSDIIQQPVDKKFPFFFDYLNLFGNIWSAEVIVWQDEINS